MDYLIKAKNLTKKYGIRTVINNIDFEIRKGEKLALIGTNGAGKSTTISMLLGMIKPDYGTIKYWCNNYNAKIGVQLQATPFFEGYTAKENLYFFASLYNQTLSNEDIKTILENCNLYEVRNTLASRLSIGQQKRLSIAVTTLHSPELIVLDEPTAGLDPKARYEIKKLIDSLSKKGITVLFSSHDLDEVWNISDRLVFLHQGNVVADGNPKELLEKFNVSNLEELYLILTESK
ncbi:ABC transporter ATP-binding protein [Anaerosporobacter sp.]|uniref:ABC transporter ATP-binding protein n=1 Tax=Anaerosporobacter sp. TaxID=1872529 RepID=UPI00286F51A1|nr:ABC transporter ATP-binding protein [Anaerosporobacter sp.]